MKTDGSKRQNDPGGRHADRQQWYWLHDRTVGRPALRGRQSWGITADCRV